MSSVDLESYKEMLQKPWGKIQYGITFAQLEHLEDKKILDFGSGFGLVSEFLSKKNDVISVEPNKEMLFANKSTNYKKILGSINVLKDLSAQSFDIIVCHNVLEYINEDERTNYLSEFKRLLKDEGKISIIKHNHVGKILQSVVFSNDVEMALKLLNDGTFSSQSFVSGKTYTIEDLLKISHFRLENYLAIRTFYSLQPNEFKNEENWLEEMTKMELTVSDLKPYKDISFLQHLWLTK